MGEFLTQSLSARFVRVTRSSWIIALSLAWVAAAAVAVVTAGPAVGVGLAFSPLAIYLVVSRSWARVAIVVVGGMLVLGSSSEVGPVKVIYAGTFLLCAVIATYRLKTRPPTWIMPFRPVFIWGAVLLVCIFLATFANPGADATAVVRSAIFYLMIPFAPIIGIDAGRDARARVVMRWIAVIGSVAAVGFAADWLSRRGVSNLTVGRFVVSSLVLPALAFALCLVRAAYSRGWARMLWYVPVVVIPAAMLATGTRTNLILFLALIGVLGAGAKRRVPFFRSLGVVAVGAALIITVFPPLVDAVVARPGFIESRILSLQTVLNGDAAGDLSFVARNEQYYYAAQWIAESPWFGKGPGFNPPISLDTPLAIVVRVGVVGASVIALFLASFLVASRATALRHGYTFMHTATTGVAVVVVAALPFGPVVEDKGFAFMLVLLSMGLASYVQERVDGTLDFPIPVPRAETPPKAPVDA